MARYDNPPENLTIRAVSRGDIPVLLELIRELADYEKLLGEVAATPELLVEGLIDSPRAEALIAEHNGEAIGYALYFHNFSTFLGRSGIYIEDIYIKPSRRKSGFGTALLKYVADIAKKRGCGRVEWSCLDWNEPSIRFYRSLGAVPMEGWTVFRVTGQALEEL